MMRRSQGGIALVEVLVAIVILGIGLIGTVALQARTYAALADTGERAEATMAAEQLIGQMTTDQANLAAYALAPHGSPSAQLQDWYNATLARIPGATVEVDVAPALSPDGPQVVGTEVVVTIQWMRKAGTAPNSQRVSAYIAQST